MATPRFEGLTILGFRRSTRGLIVDIRLLVASCRVAPRARSEPLESAGETIGDIGAIRRPTRLSPVRFRPGPSPKTPRTRAYFGAIARNGRAVSAPPDYMAVRAVESEPVSGANSLIYRENTGNSPRSGSSC